MKRIVILALAMALILPLISCAGNKDKKDGGKETGTGAETETETGPEAVTLRSGLYYPDGANLEEELPQYFEIDAVNMTWRNGQSLAISYFIEGTITVKPVKAVATGKDTKIKEVEFFVLENDDGVRVEICPNSGSMFTVISSEGEENVPWLPKVGDVFILNDLSLHLTGRTYDSKEEFDKYRSFGSDLDPRDVLFRDVFCDAEDLLGICREIPVLVAGAEKGGRALWDEFCEKTSRGEAATILIAYFYRPEYGPDGPYPEGEAPLMAELSRIEYDGKVFLNSYRRSSEKFYAETDGYECLKCFNDAPSGEKTWYLCDDPNLTYDEFMKSYLSSYSGDFIHATLAYAEETPSVDFETSPDDKTVIDLSTRVYDEGQLHKIMNFKGPIEKLDEEYPIECIRALQDGTYRVSYLGEESVVSVWFDEYGDTTYSKSFSDKLSKSDLTGLSQGMSFDEVRELDPDGDYPFVYSNVYVFQNVSHHYTKDGYLITITYDDALTITDISVGLI
ncbi:MAG: hypothetical protein IKI91_03565 [Clostridia bacterium]|nr:hypothetical protein [Clostridia bacterium]